MFNPPVFSKKHMNQRCAFSITAHAMVQYLSRGTKFDLAGARHTFHKKRKKAGLITKRLTDKDLLQHLEEGQGYLGHKGILEHRLKKSWRVHRDEQSCFRLLETGLVAVTNSTDKTVVTVLTQEMAQKKVPFDLSLAFEVYMDALTVQSLNSTNSATAKKTFDPEPLLN